MRRLLSTTAVAAVWFVAVAATAQFDPDNLQTHDACDVYPNTCAWDQENCDFRDFDGLDRPTRFYSVDLQKKAKGSLSKTATLHGLWPSYEPHDSPAGQPAACSGGLEFDENAYSTLEPFFKKYWITSKKGLGAQQCFISHEWWRHGTCTYVKGKPIDPQTYYLTAFALLSLYRGPLAGNLIWRAGRNPSDWYNSGFRVSNTCVECLANKVENWDINPALLNQLPVETDCLKVCRQCKDNCF